MVMLWRQETGRGAQSLRNMGMTPEELLVTWRDYEHLMWIERDGERVGATHLEIKRMTESVNDVEESLGYQLKSRSRAKLAMGGGWLAIEIPVSVELGATMGNDFELDDFQAKIKAGPQVIRTEGFVSGDSLFYRVRIGEPEAGEAHTPAGALMTPQDICGSFKLSGPVILTSVIDPIVTSRTEKMEEGGSWTTTAVNPLLGSHAVEVRVTVEALEILRGENGEVETWRLRERAGELESVSWYDVDGRLMRSEMPGGLTLVATRFSSVRALYPEFSGRLVFDPIDRQWIRKHQNPDFEGARIEDVMPMTQLFQQ